MVRKKEKMDVEKGQIRQTKSGECRLILMVTDTECLITGEDGEALYKGMKPETKYTLKELGIIYNE